MKIVHLTSAHDRYDIRIFIKMCCSLAKHEGWDVSLVVADGLGYEERNGVKIYDVGQKKGTRISRMTNTVLKVYHMAKSLNSDIYHLHDPELIPVGVLLKLSGKKVIFDAHEDLPKQLLGKPYLNKILKIVLSNSFKVFEKITCNKFNYIISATPYIRDKFSLINKSSIDINNYPIIGELSIGDSKGLKKNEVCYVGGIAEIRGIKEVVKAMELTNNVKLNLVGEFSSKELETEVRGYNGWKNVVAMGVLNRYQVAEVMNQSKVGIVTFLPLPNHIDAQPNKMFEYMSAGIPIVTSNFPLWKEIVEGNDCGICVSPLEPKEIAGAIDYLVSNEEIAERMGRNGKNAVLNRYNWAVEEKKLFEVYNKVIND
jgi:glycosyltransferase involved in cell wall biosynthesis